MERLALVELLNVVAGVLQGFFCEAGSLGWRDRETRTILWERLLLWE